MLTINTFLPYSDFAKSAACLDNKRLGKQRVEAYQLLKGQFPNHPASKMWVGYKDTLCYYGMAMCNEWINRGYIDNLHDEFYLTITEEIIYPPWLGSNRLHSSHRANLLRKDPLHYNKFNWSEKPSDSYFWPSATYNYRTNIDFRD